MTAEDKIKEVMVLVEKLATDFISVGIANMAGTESARSETQRDARDSYAELESKLRELIKDDE